MRDYLILQYLPALASTLAIELGVAALLGWRTPRQFGAVGIVNLVTHPLLHVVLWVTGWSQPAALLGLEVAVFLAEGALLMRLLRLPAGRALMASAVMNTTSAILGLVWFQ